jgi:hypothetical protein
MSNAKMSRVCTPLEQPIENRASGADAATLNSAATIQVVPPATPSTLDAASSLAHRSAEPKPPCQQSITISFFFDGTGNNLDADTDVQLESAANFKSARGFRLGGPGGKAI